ncbi:hypothetical protein RintRC_1632 [Richelia intracellularis]|nr:hypothetical protein RintRC_1632 [Richelia intracellularis]
MCHHGLKACVPMHPEAQFTEKIEGLPNLEIESKSDTGK